MVQESNILCLLTVILCIKESISVDNTTDSFLSMNNDQLKYGKHKTDYIYPGRQSRYLSFHSDGSVVVDLEFAIPFVKIPVKKAMENFSQGLPLANVNVAAILLAGAVIFGIAVMIPGFSGMLSPYIFGKSASRGLEETEWWRVMTQVDQVLLDNNIDTTACMQKSACSLIQSASQKVLSGQAKSTDKIIDGFASNPWIKNKFYGTAIHDAIEAGYRSDNCAQIYSSCRISQNSLQNFAKRFYNNFTNQK